MDYYSYINGRAQVDLDKLLSMPINEEKMNEIIDSYDNFYDSFPVHKSELILVQIASDWSDIFENEVDAYDIVKDLRNGFMATEADEVKAYHIDEILKEFVSAYANVLIDLIVEREGSEWDDFEQLRLVKDGGEARLEYCQAEVTVSYNNWKVA